MCYYDAMFCKTKEESPNLSLFLFSPFNFHDTIFREENYVYSITCTLRTYNTLKSLNSLLFKLTGVAITEVAVKSTQLRLPQI